MWLFRAIGGRCEMATSARNGEVIESRKAPTATPDLRRPRLARERRGPVRAPRQEGRTAALTSGSGSRRTACGPSFLYPRPMAVDRLLPTARPATCRSRPRHRRQGARSRSSPSTTAGTYPEGLRDARRPGLLSLPYPEEQGGGGQPYEVYLQVLEELAAAGPLSRRGQRAQLRATRSPPSAPTSRRSAGCRDMLGASCSAAYSLSEPQAGSDAAALVQGRARPRRLPHHRHQGMDHPRGQGRLLHAVRPHRRGLTRHLLLPRAGPRRRADVRQARAQDGPARGPDDHRALRRRAASTPTGCIGDEGQGLHRVQRTRLRPARHRRRRHRAGAGRTRRGRRLRPGARGVRQARSSTTRGSASCSPTWRRPSTRPARPTSTPPAGATPAALQPRRQRGQARRDRRRHEGHHRRRAGARRLRLHARLPGRALHARGQDHADLRGHQPDPAARHQPRAGATDEFMAAAGLPWVEDDDAPVPTRPGSACRRRTLTIPAQETVPYVAEEWRGAIVTIERGSVDLVACGAAAVGLSRTRSCSSKASLWSAPQPRRRGPVLVALSRR